MVRSTQPRRLPANAVLLAALLAVVAVMGALVVFTLAHRDEAQPTAVEKPASSATP